jgi:hypothetical protein
MSALPEGQHVLVIGSAGIDVKARPAEKLAPGSAVPGLIAWPVMNRARSTLQRARVVARMTTTRLAASVSQLLLPFFSSSHKDD